MVPPCAWFLIFALYLPWCRYLEAVPSVSPQLYAYNLNCVSGSPEALLSAAWFTYLYIILVGQEAAPRKCVFLSTSRQVHAEMASWFVTGAGDTWPFELDGRDLEGHLDLTYRGRASTFCRRIDGGRLTRPSGACFAFGVWW